MRVIIDYGADKEQASLRWSEDDHVLERVARQGQGLTALQHQELHRIACNFAIVANKEVVGGCIESGDRPVSRMWHIHGDPQGALGSRRDSLHTGCRGLGTPPYATLRCDAPPARIWILPRNFVNTAAIERVPFTVAGRRIVDGLAGVQRALERDLRAGVGVVTRTAGGNIRPPRPFSTPPAR